MTGLPKSARLDDREIGLEDDPLGAHVGLGMLAEGDDAPARRGGGMGAQALEIGIVAVDDGRAARLEAREDLALGVGDAPDRAEILDVDRLDRRDDRHVRPDHAASAARSRPAWFMPISKTPKALLRGMRASVSGTPQ